MVDVRFKVEGQDDFLNALRRLDSRTARNGLNRALRQAVQPARKQARSNVDSRVGRDTGEGRKAIKVRTMKKAEREARGIDQGALLFLDPDGFYLAFWEFGFTRNGRHYPARPWMRPAVDSTTGSVVMRYMQRAGVVIERAAEKKRGRKR